MKAGTGESVGERSDVLSNVGSTRVRVPAHTGPEGHRSCCRVCSPLAPHARCLSRSTDGFSTGVNFELPHDRGHVSLHGRTGQMKRCGDLCVGHPLGDQSKDHLLSPTQRLGMPSGTRLGGGHLSSVSSRSGRLSCHQEAKPNVADRVGLARSRSGISRRRRPGSPLTPAEGTSDRRQISVGKAC